MKACLAAVSTVFIAAIAGATPAQASPTFSDTTLSNSAITLPLSVAQYEEGGNNGPLTSVQFTLNYTITTKAGAISIFGDQSATSVSTSVPITLELFWGNTEIASANVVGTDSGESISVTTAMQEVYAATGQQQSNSAYSTTYTSLNSPNSLSELVGSGDDSNFSVKMFVGPGAVSSNGSGDFGMFYGGTASISGGIVVNYVDSPVPEPSTWISFGAAACGIALITGKRRARA